MPRKKREEITSETCLSCGICCVAPNDQPAFCDVEKKDMERLGKRWSKLHVLQPSAVDVFAHALDGNWRLPYGAIETRWRTMGSGPLKGVDVCACVALKGTVMKKVKCSVYDRRPKVCREAVKPGDKTCRQLRREVLEQCTS